MSLPRESAHEPGKSAGARVRKRRKPAAVKRATKKKRAAPSRSPVALDRYRKKRDFEKTPEPSGAPSAERAPRRAGELGFVIQKHAASRLHYDFRLELDGVLKSWAVPKGPSLDPGEKRLAVHVEDHPIDYAEFEGVIPKGEYGGGSVMVWDRGTWEPEGDPKAALARGRLSFRLRGEKLEGAWSLVRMRSDRAAPRGRSSGGHAGEADNWLLIKKKDEFSGAGGEAEVTERRAESVISGRDMDAIARDADSVWHSNRAARGAETERTRRSKKPRPRSHPAGASEAAMPESVAPELATLVRETPSGPEWIYEMKLDGYRALAFLEAGRARFMSRNQKDWTESMKPLADRVAELPASSAVLDGEVVVLEPDGTTSFQRLQNALAERRADELVYYAFDLLYLDGHDYRAAPLLERKAALRALLAGLEGGSVRYGEHVEGDGAEIFRKACALGVEGIVAKRRDSTYEERRTRDWLKVKCTAEQELVIGGYTDPEGARTGVGALLVGVHDADGTLRYAGKVGSGFTRESLEELESKLAPLARERSPFADLARARRGVHFVEPELVAAVSFTEWTRDGHLRHPVFRGLRVDRTPAEVVRERASPERPALPIEITNPDRVLYEERGLTKRALAEYYAAVAERMLPHVAGRPLMLLRCPEGRQKQCFFQKHPTRGQPAAARTVEIEEKAGQKKPSLYVDSVEGLVSLVQMGALEVHVWGSRIDRVERPDRLVFDLDPDEGVPWARVTESAVALRALLAELDLESFLKTTGGKGLHVVVPIARDIGWDDAKTFSQGIAGEMVRRAPDEFVATMSKAKRHGKIFIDYFRNSRGATWVAPYSSRARPNAPVSLPIAWDELETLRGPDAFDVTGVLERLASEAPDPWAGIERVEQSIERALAGGARRSRKKRSA